MRPSRMDMSSLAPEVESNGWTRARPLGWKAQRALQAKAWQQENMEPSRKKKLMF